MTDYLFGLVTGFFAAYLVWMVATCIDAVVHDEPADEEVNAAILDDLERQMDALIEEKRRQRRDWVERQ